MLNGKRLCGTISKILSKTQDEHENANETTTTKTLTLTSEKVTASCTTNEEGVDEAEFDGIRVKMEPLDIGTYENEDDDTDDYYFNHDNESISSSSLSFRYPVRNSPSRYNHRLAATQSELAEEETSNNEKKTKKGFLNLWERFCIYLVNLTSFDLKVNRVHRENRKSQT